MLYCRSHIDDYHSDHHIGSVRVGILVTIHYQAVEKYSGHCIGYKRKHRLLSAGSLCRLIWVANILVVIKVIIGARYMAINPVII
jgi:hypothetical protein